MQKTATIKDAISFRFLDENERRIESTLRGLNDIKNGRTTNIDDVIAEWESKSRTSRR